MNTCAFIEAARQESIDAVLALADLRRAGARLVVTGCLAERYGDQLLDALTEVDLVAGFGPSLTRPSPTPGRRAGGRVPRLGSVHLARRPAPSTDSISWSCPGPPPVPLGPT